MCSPGLDLQDTEGPADPSGLLSPSSVLLRAEDPQVWSPLALLGSSDRKDQACKIGQVLTVLS
jgi:hypothetical protein